ncbi:hypothetical protein [Mycetocola sp. 2940]|uniref:hypothetical protein n=1 Tax=Mycetocola sp. 2940 TaxID=3156452 RepID=UPI003394DE4B
MPAVCNRARLCWRSACGPVRITTHNIDPANVTIAISNADPFEGGKHSGLGREGIAEYTTTQRIGIADPHCA